PAVARIVLPAVFAVQDHRDHRGTAADAPACGPDALMEVVSGSVGLHAGIHEADEVGKLVVAEEDADSRISLPAAGKAMRAVELVPPGTRSVRLTMEAHLERTAQHPFVRRRPHKALRGREGQRLIRNAALARPKTARPAAEDPFVEGDGLAQLGAGVFGMAETLPRQIHARVRLRRDARVAKERQDGVVEGRSGELDLAAGAGRAVLLKCYPK